MTEVLPARIGPQQARRRLSQTAAAADPATIERLQGQAGNQATGVLIDRLRESMGSLPEGTAGDLLLAAEEFGEPEELVPEGAPTPAEEVDVDRSADIDPPSDGDDTSGEEPGDSDGAPPLLAPLEPPLGTDQSSGAGASSRAAFKPPDDGGLDAPQERTGRVPLSLSGANGGQLQREEDDSFLGISLPSLSTVLDSVPGYDLLKLVIGFDPVTGSTVEVSPERLVGAIMGMVPGGAAIYDELSRSEVVASTFELIDSELDQADLTASRIERVVERAWDEVDLEPRFGVIDDAIVVVNRHVDQLTADVEQFARSLTGSVFDILRSAALDQAEALLAASPAAAQAWDLTKSVMGHDPLRDERVENSTEEIIASFLTLIGRETELEQMREKRTLAETAEWIDSQLGTFDSILGEFGQLIDQALAALSSDQIMNLGENLEQLARDGLALIGRVSDFALTVAEKVLELIKDSLLSALNQHASEVPGFDLVAVLAGRNPLTGEVVPQTPETIIRGFMTLMPGGHQQYVELEQTGVIPQAAARIQAAIDELGISWEFVSGLFEDIWASFSVDDLLVPLEAFQRVIDRFVAPIGRLFAFISSVVQEVFELVLGLMGFPSELLGRIIANAMAAFGQIQQDPIGFLKNLLATLKLGFTNFFGNILDHLLSGLTEFLFRGLRAAGIEPPEALTLEGILDVVLQVLGLSVDNLWNKLAERIGPERVARLRAAADRLEGLWNFVSDVQERGIVAVWEYIEGQITTLWDIILEKAQEWIVSQVIEGVMVRLLSMLDPTGVMAVVNSFVSFFQAVQSAIEYFREILEIVDRYVATIADIAAGNLGIGASQLEAGLASSIPVAIGFLANQVGLGDLAGEIQNIIEGVREVVDEGIDWLLDRAVEMGSSMLAGLGLGVEDGAEEADAAGADVDAADHDAFAAHAAAQLQAVPVDDAADPLDATVAAARRLEPALSERLAGNIALTFLFPGGRDDAADGEIDFVVSIAPNTTEKSAVKAVDDGPGHARVGGDVGGELLVGLSGSYRSVKSSQDPRKAEIPSLGLEAEHVIPRKTVVQLSRGLRSFGAPRGGAMDESMITIKIYDAAADRKTASDPSDPTVAARVEELISQGRGAADAGPYRNETARMGTVLRLLLQEVEVIREERLAATVAAVQTDNAGPGGEARGTTADSLPGDGQIVDAAQRQARQVREFLEDAADAASYARDEGGAFALIQSVSSSFGGSELDTFDDYATRIPLGARGGRGERGFGTVRIAGDDWVLQLGRSGRIKPELQGQVVGRGSVDSALAISEAGVAIQAARRGDHDAEGPLEARSYPASYRAVILQSFDHTATTQTYATAAEVAVTQHGAAAAAAQNAGERFPDHPPAPGTVEGWARALRDGS